MSWANLKKKHKTIPKNAVEIGYVAAFSDPDDKYAIDSSEVTYSDSHESFVMMVMPLWYSVKEYIVDELEPAFHLKDNDV